MDNLSNNICPLCGSHDLQFLFKVKDQLVTGDLFSIVGCVECGLRFTADAPPVEKIGAYYKSENYISHTNNQQGLMNRAYQLVRKITLAGKKRLIEKSTGRSSGRLLDVGSGTGSFVQEMKKHGWEATGLEPDEDARKVAADVFNITLLPAEELFTLTASSFDVITLWHVLEHVHDLHRYVQQLKALLKPDGKIFIAVPNFTSGDAAHYKEFWAAYDVPRHLYHFSPAAMQRLMDRNGLLVKKYKPMWFDSFYISLLSSQYKKKKGLSKLAEAVFQGAVSNLRAMSDVKKCSSVIYIIEKKKD